MLHGVKAYQNNIEFIADQIKHVAVSTYFKHM